MAFAPTLTARRGVVAPAVRRAAARAAPSKSGRPAARRAVARVVASATPTADELGFKEMRKGVKAG